jgi:hypothetical protein
MRVLLSFAFIFWSGLSARAEPLTLRLGEMELVYDAARWRADATSDASVMMQPIGALATVLDPVRVTKAPDIGRDGCEGLARTQLSASLYDRPTIVPFAVANVRAIRMEAHSRCRNAMPSGVAVCMPYRGSGYVLTVSQTGCRDGARNLFSGIDPLEELVRGIRFVP